jgi:hypothetical protein
MSLLDQLLDELTNDNGDAWVGASAIMAELGRITLQRLGFEPAGKA